MTPQVRCPSCKRGMILKNDRCPECGLSWEDLEAATDHFAHVLQTHVKKER